LDIFSILEKNEFTQTDALLSGMFNQVRFHEISNRSVSVGYVPGAEGLLVMADFAAGLRDKNPDLLFVLDRELRVLEELILVTHLVF
jgi:pyridoxal/pyridoxine/pyridoxamine kinase